MFLYWANVFLYSQRSRDCILTVFHIRAEVEKPKNFQLSTAKYKTVPQFKEKQICIKLFAELTDVDHKSLVYVTAYLLFIILLMAIVMT